MSHFILRCLKSSSFLNHQVWLLLLKVDFNYISGSSRLRSIMNKVIQYAGKPEEAYTDLYTHLENLIAKYVFEKFINIFLICHMS